MFTAGVANSVLDPRLVYSCFTAVLKGAQSPSLPSARPAVYEQILELLYSLAAAPVTSDATLTLLRRVQLVVSQLYIITDSLVSNQVITLLPQHALSDIADLNLVFCISQAPHMPLLLVQPAAGLLLSLKHTCVAL